MTADTTDATPNHQDFIAHKTQHMTVIYHRRPTMRRSKFETSFQCQHMALFKKERALDFVNAVYRSRLPVLLFVQSRHNMPVAVHSR